MSLIGWFLSLIWQGFLGLFGMSDAQKLGRAEERSKTQAEALQEVNTAHEIEDGNNRSLGNGDALKQLRSKWSRK